MHSLVVRYPPLLDNLVLIWELSALAHSQYQYKVLFQARFNDKAVHSFKMSKYHMFPEYKIHCNEQ